MEIKNIMVDDYNIDFDKLQYIESVLESKAVTESLHETTIDPVVAGRWYGNFNGYL